MQLIPLNPANHFALWRLYGDSNQPIFITEFSDRLFCSMMESRPGSSELFDWAKASSTWTGSRAFFTPLCCGTLDNRKRHSNCFNFLHFGGHLRQKIVEIPSRQAWIYVTAGKPNFLCGKAVSSSTLLCRVDILSCRQLGRRYGWEMSHLDKSPLTMKLIWTFKIERQLHLLSTRSCLSKSWVLHIEWVLSKNGWWLSTDCSHKKDFNVFFLQTGVFQLVAHQQQPGWALFAQMQMLSLFSLVAKSFVCLKRKCHFFPADRSKLGKKEKRVSRKWRQQRRM